MKDKVLIVMLSNESTWKANEIKEAHREARGYTFDVDDEGKPFRAGCDSSMARELTPEEVEKYLAWKKSMRPTLETI
jgi:hypothetical protein